MAGQPEDYSGILVTEDLNELRDLVMSAAAMFEADLKPALASRARRAFIQLVDDLNLIAVQVAQRAHDKILQDEVQSRVRPDTEGADGSERLEDYLGESHPLDLLPGSVGINDEQVLDDNVGWWFEHEEGYSGLIGHEVVGFFFDSGFTAASRPDQNQFREHPIFAPAGRGPTMTVNRPIPARRFVQHGYQDAEAYWHTRVRAARARFDKESDRIWAAFNAAP